MDSEPRLEVVFGISGSISAYKSLDVIRQLRKKGVSITPMLSGRAHQFVTPWSVETLSESQLIQTDVIAGKITHLEQIKSANLFVICPASANMISKLATGACSDMVSSAFLSFKGKKVIFPAMHTEMYENRITQNNLSSLKAQGVVVIPPDSGPLACCDTGLGRLPDTAIISQLIYAQLLGSLSLNGKRIVITCGGTSEPMDTVRYITNAGSGISGHAIANIAAGAGANVTLIRSKSHSTLSTIACIDVASASDMQHAVLNCVDCDALIMNAAVSDFTILPTQKKQPRSGPISLSLTPTTDILKAFNQKKNPKCQSIGFCLSDDDVIRIAQQKRIEKGCDAMIANSPESFGQSHRSFHVITPTKVTSHKNLPLERVAIEILALLN